MVDILIYLGVFVIFIIAAWYVLSQMNLPEPLGKMITIALVVVGAIILIIILLQFRGGHGLSLGWVPLALGIA